MADLRQFRHTFVNNLHTLRLCLDVLDRAGHGAHPEFHAEWLASLEQSADRCIEALDDYYLDHRTILASCGVQQHH
jgi:hypothetical protein